jgi:hypothetical protein
VPTYFLAGTYWKSLFSRHFLTLLHYPPKSLGFSYHFDSIFFHPVGKREANDQEGREKTKEMYSSQYDSTFASSQSTQSPDSSSAKVKFSLQFIKFPHFDIFQQISSLEPDMCIQIGCYVIQSFNL